MSFTKHYTRETWSKLINKNSDRQGKTMMTTQGKEIPKSVVLHVSHDFVRYAVRGRVVDDMVHIHELHLNGTNECVCVWVHDLKTLLEL